MAASCILPIRGEVLDDLANRFLSNLPEKEGNDHLMNVCGQLELAHWYYLDLMRPEDASLPASSFKEFLTTMFHHCSSILPSPHNIDTLPDRWKAFKHSKPVRGAIILNTDLTKCLLVQGYPASTSWSFPKGKKESGETDVSAAVREVYEEVGFNINELIKEDRYLDKHYNHKSSQNSSTASVTTTSDGPYARMYIIPGISEDEHFEPKARKEIRRIQWHNISDIPTCRYDEVTKTHIKGSNKFFLIISFMKPLKDWIYKYKNKKYGQFRTPSPRRRNGHTHSTSKLKRVPMLEKFNAHSSNFHLTNSSERSTQLTSTGVSHTHLAPPTIAYTPGNTHLATAHGHTPSIIHSSIPIISHAYFSAPVTRIHSSEQTNSPYDSFVKQLMGHAHHTHRKPLPQPLKLEPLLNNVHYPRHLSHSPRSPSTVVTLQPSMIFCNFQFNKHLILQAYNNNSSIS